MLKELIAEEDVIEVVQAFKFFRASEAGECETYLCHKALGHTPLSLPGRVRHMLADGATHERDIVERLQNKGIDVQYCLDRQMTVKCVDEPDVQVSGHPDGLIEHQAPGFELDYTEPGFRFDRGTYLLEVTAPGHFPFLRIEREHMRVALWRKYVQVQLYLNSLSVRERTDCCVVEVKNKNTSALYEEGVIFHQDVVADTVAKLRRVQDFVSDGKVSAFRCVDWRRQYCQYRELCFASDIVEVEPTTGILIGENLKNAEELLQAADAWLKGRDLAASGEELIEDARALFRATIEENEAEGLTVAQARALMVTAHRRKVDLDVLKVTYPEVYDAVVYTEPSTYVRVTRD